MMPAVLTPLMTADEFFGWIHLPENEHRLFELERGKVIEMPLASKFHGFVCGNIGRILGVFAVARRRGYICTNDTGIIVERDPDTVRGPDVTFYEDNQTAADMERKFAIIPPILAVEVMSPSDRLNKVLKRVTQLLNRGVILVWVVDPETRDVSVYRQGRDPIVIDETAEITGEDVLPDFRCRVSEFFAMPGA